MSQDIKTLLPELKRLAEAATPGPWRNAGKDGYDVMVAAPEHKIILWRCNGYFKGGTDAATADADYVSAANPATLLALVAHIEALERQLAELRQAPTPTVDALMAKWGDDGATRGPAFIELRDLARELERQMAEVNLLAGAFWRLDKYGYIRADDDDESGQCEHWINIGRQAVAALRPRPAAPSAGQAKPDDGQFAKEDHGH